MKYEGIVIKLTKNKAIVSTDDFQCFYIKRSPTIYVGKQVEFTKRDIISKGAIRAKIIFSAACFLLVFAFGLRFLGITNISDIISYPKAFAYIGVDFNPSIDIEIDEEGMVLRLVPLNEDAKVLIKKIDTGKIDISKVIDNMIDTAENNGIVFESEKEFLLVSSTLNSNRNENDREYQIDKKKLDTILNSLKNSIQERRKVNIYIVQANKSERKDAQDKGISTGRYKLYNELKENIKEFSIEEAKSISVNELIEWRTNQEAEEVFNTTPIPTASPSKVEETEINVTATPTDDLNDKSTSDTAPPQTPTITPMSTPTVTPKILETSTPAPVITAKPQIIPTPTITPKTLQTSHPIPTATSSNVIIPMPMPMPTLPFIPPPFVTAGQASNSVYMKFEAYNYPGQFIQHKIHFDAYISANGILPGDSIFKIVPGLADPDCISFESKNFPGFYLKNENFKIVLKPFDGSKDFKENVTFRKVSGLADDQLTSFQSFNYPDRYIRHKNFILHVDEIVSDDDKKDATYKGIEVE